MCLLHQIKTRTRPSAITWPNHRTFCLCLAALLPMAQTHAQQSETQVLSEPQALSEIDVTEQTEAERGNARLQKVTVVANRSPRQITELTGTVSVIDSETIARDLSSDLKNLVRYTPGVDVNNQGSRFGLGGFIIRGIGGNRVLTEVDGVPVSDAFAIGSFSNAGRDFIDVDLLKQVEIVRGAASSLFGSDAIGGVVSFVTKDPLDVLAGETASAGFKAAYFSADNQHAGRATGAAQWQDWSALISLSRRSSEALETNAVLDADPFEQRSYSLLAKLVYDFGDNPLRFTLDGLDADSTTDVQSLLGIQDFSAGFGFPFLLETSQVLADDDRERQRISVEQDLAANNSWLAGGQWRLFYQNSDTVQRTIEQRSTIIFGEPDPQQRMRVFDFDQQSLGAELYLQSHFSTNNIRHRLVYGFELEHVQTDQVRDGSALSLLTGEVSNVVGPDSFPVRDFPQSDTLSIGWFVQDEIELLGKRLMLVPGLRIDYYDLDSNPDDIFLADNPGIQTVNLNEFSVSPKLGLIWQLGGGYDLVAQYARGFRAPPFNDVNIGFTNFQFGYTALPNPDLQPETSDSFELGLRGNWQDFSFHLTGFYNLYDDFIESLSLIGVRDDGILQFQSINLQSAEIFGVEFAFQWHLDNWAPGLSWQTSASWSEGNDRSNDTPLNSISPGQLVSGLLWQSQDERYGINLHGTYTRAQNRLNDPDQNLARSDEFATVDITGWAQLSDFARLNVGVFNLTDSNYVEWPDIQGRTQGDPVLLRLGRPGINFNASVNFTF